MIDVKDRVPSQVLSNGAIRYEEFDAEGNSLGYKYIKRADEPTEVGTPINKVLFDSIKNDINQAGKVHQCSLSQSELNFAKLKTALFPTSGWQTVTENVKYQNSDFIIESSSDPSRSVLNAFDGNDSSYWEENGDSRTGYLKIDCGKPYKIYEFKIVMDYDDSYGSVKLQASNDNTNFVDLKVVPENSKKATQIITINNPDAYRYYRLYHYSSNYKRPLIYTFQATVIENGANLITIDDSFITSYYIGERLLIKIPNTFSRNISKTYIKVKNLGEIEIEGSLFAGLTYSLIYDGTKFIATPLEERPIIGRMVPTSGWVADTDTADYKPTAYANNEWGKWRIAGISSSKTGVELVVDGNETTGMAVSSESGAYFTIAFPTQLLIAPEVLQIKYTAGTITSIQGKNEDGIWEQIKYTIVDSTDSKNTILALPKYFTAIQVNLSNTSNAALYEFLIMQGHYKFKS